MRWRCKSRECDFEQVYSNHHNPSARYAHAPVDVLICRSCGLVALDSDEVTEEWISQYYATFNPFERPGPLTPGHRALRAEQVAWVLDNLPEGHGVRTVLDVGCGAGYMLALLRDHGFDVRGLDESPAMIENLRATYGIEGTVGSFDAETAGGPYDLVTCVTVLEHMLDASATIGTLACVLDDGGFVYVEVPDAEFPRADMVPDHLAFEHLFHFTERTLARLLELGGFEIIEVAHVDNPADSGNPESALRILARLVETPRPRYIGVNDYEHELDVLRRYRKQHEAYLARFDERLRDLKSKVGDEELVIYCAGEHTAALLDRFDLGAFTIPFIVDGDPAIAGSEIAGIPVRHRSELPGTPVRHFLLSTTNHEREIYEDLKALDPAFRVYGLYTQLD